MKIALISYSSPVHDQKKIDKSLRDFLNELTTSFDIDFFNINNLMSLELEKYDLILNFIKTGGTEYLIKENYNKLPQPIYLLTTSLHNSLPAALEIMSFIKNQGGEGRIFHGRKDHLLKEIEKYALINHVKQDLKEKKIGVIGKPSDWLISSTVNYESVYNKWGLKIKDIPLKEIYKKLNKLEENQINKITNHFINNSIEMKENSKNDVWEASRIYLVLKELIRYYNLDAVTIRCFDIVKELGTTGCLALSYLNDEGIIAGCEGDIPATFTMMLTFYLTGSKSFMANPFQIEPENNIVNFAHCTVPTTMCDSITARSHFETGIGVGIQGKLPTGKATVIRTGGSDLTRFYIEEGKILENTDVSNACRTQIKMKFDTNIEDYYLNEPLGNHHIIVPGSHYKLFQNFIKAGVKK